jgi:hypothetical protein
MESWRLVVTFWMPHQGIESRGGRSFLDRARVLMQQAEALGATVIAWSGATIGFGLEPDSAEEAVALAQHVADAHEGEVAWSAGIAEGALDALGDKRDALWGPAMAYSQALARGGAGGEVLVHASVKALAAGEMLNIGRRAIVERGRRIVGARLDLNQPWRRDALAQVSRIRRAPLLARENPGALLCMPGALSVLRADPGMGGTRLLSELRRLVAPGPSLLVQPSGSGLEPLGALRRALGRAEAQGAQPLEPELEPALKRLIIGDGVPIETAATLVVGFLRPHGKEVLPGALLVDDASDVDAATLEACARAVELSKRSFAFVVRLDATSSVPNALKNVPRGPEMDLKPLNREDAEALVGACVGGALEGDARKRWARRGGYSPLGVVESVTTGIANGDLAWLGERAYARQRASGKGKVWPASYWIARRAEGTSPAGQCVLAVATLLGGEAAITRVEDVLRLANAPLDVRDEAARLVQMRWLVEPEEGWIAMPTRTHRDAILGEFLNEATRRVIHRALAHVLEREERGLGLAEAAHHAARAGDNERAAKIALHAAKIAAQFGLEQATIQLIAFAREHDPSCDEEARAQLASHVPARVVVRNDAAADADDETLNGVQVVLPPQVRSGTAYVAANTMSELAVPAEDVNVASDPLVAPASRRGSTAGYAAYPQSSTHNVPNDSEPPTVATASPEHDEESTTELRLRPEFTGAPDGPPTEDIDIPIELVPASARPPKYTPVERAPESSTPADVGRRLTELAKEALLGADMRALERWSEGLLASGGNSKLAERMQAMARLSRGDHGDALRVLRTAREALEGEGSQAARCQASLALGFALAQAGRLDEALLEGLDALARARQNDDEKAANACLAFLAKLFQGLGRADDAERLRAIAKIPSSMLPPPAQGAAAAPRS